MVQFKVKCSRCKANYVAVSGRNAYGATCLECSKKDMQGEIKDPEMKKMFDIPEELYEKSSFLRNIKINYLRYGSLSEKQVETFRKVVGDLTEKQNKPAEVKEKKEFKVEDIETSPVSMRLQRLEKKKKAEEKKAAKKASAQ